MDACNIRTALIDSVVHVVAEKGIDKATTKALAEYAKLNEVYIYRVCGSKEKLLRNTFDVLDIQFRNCILEKSVILNELHLSVNDRARKYFDEVWDFILNDPRKCSFFIRYYYSRYFNDYPFEFRKNIYKDVIERFSLIFKDEIDVWMLINHIFDVLFSSAVKILRSEVPNNKLFADSVYNMLSMSVKPYLKYDGIV